MVKSLLKLCGLLLAVVLVVSVVLAALFPRPAQALPPSPAVQRWLLAARPSSEFGLFLKLNGSPTKLGVIVSAGGATTTNSSTAAPFTIAAGDTVMTYCDAAAFCIEGASASTSISNAAFGRPQPLATEVYWVFKGTSAITFACAGAAAFNCAVFRMD